MMRRAIAWTTSAAIAMCSGRSSAQDASSPGEPEKQQAAPAAPATPSPPASPVQPAMPAPAIAPARIVRSVALLVPAKLEANTSGDATARVGVGPLWSVADNWDLSLIPNLQVATSDGIAELLGVTDGADVTSTLTGKAGLSIGLTQLDVSDEGHGTPYLPMAIFAGGDVSRATYTFRTPQPGTVNALEVHANDARVGGSAGVSGYKLWPQSSWSPTIEWLATYRSDYTASSRKIRWCRSAGTVDGADAQSCSEGILGGPSHSQRFVAGLHIGILQTDPKSHAWRPALGAQITIPTERDDVDHYTIDLRAPVYLTLGRAGSDNTWSSYAGIVRLMPQLTINRPKGGAAEAAATLQLQLLGQRRLFAETYDGTL